MAKKKLLNLRTVALKKNLRGIVQNLAETFMNATEAVDIINGHSTEEGSWSFDKAGYTKVNSGGTAYESGASIDGLHWFTDSSFVDHLIAGINGKIKVIDTGTGVASDIDASAGFTAGNPVDFQTFNYSLFSCDGTVNPRKWDGASASAATGWPVTDTGGNTYSKPKFVEEHQGRLVTANFQGGTGAMTKYPSHLIMSDLDNGESYTLNPDGGDGMYIVGIGTGDGQQITGMKSINIPALNASQLVVVKERSIYAVTGNSSVISDVDAFTVVKLNGDYGAFNNRCIVQFGKDLLLLNEFGIISVTTTLVSGNINTSPIESDLVTRTIGRINLLAKDKCWSIHLKDRREIWFFIPTGSSTVCNEAIVYRYPTPGDPNGVPKWSRRTSIASKFLMSAGVVLSRTFYVGSTAGILGTMFTSSTYDGTAIPWLYEYPYYDFGNEKQIKSIANAEAQFKVRGSQTLTITTQWKGGNNNDRFSNPITLTSTLAGAAYGSAHYGVDYYGEQQELSVPFLAPGNGRRLKIILQGNTDLTGPEFLGINTVPQFGAISMHWN